MKPTPKTFLRILSATLATLLCGGVVAPLAAHADSGEDGTTQITVNDSEMGTGMFKFDFAGKWVHEGGYPNRFEGGDEHWTTTAQFGTDYPSVTFRFVGTRIALYGHKVPDSPFVRITLDGKDMGTVDLYHPSRVEKVLLYQSDTLSDGEHSITMEVLAEKNPSAGSTHEVSIDYAVVTTAATLPATGVKPAKDTVTLETGMTYPLTYTVLPDYATTVPAITFASSDDSVATVDTEGNITAKSVGKATITLAAADGSFTATVALTVREPIAGDLTAVAGDTNVHTMQEDYYSTFDKLTGTESTTLSATAWLNDTAAAKLDLLTAGKALTNVKVTVGDMVNTHGDKLTGSVTPYFIKTVLAHDTGKYVPDVLYSTEAFDMPAASVASVWLAIETASDALPGVYTGIVTVTADELTTPETLTLSVEVIALACPESEIPFEIWQYPYSSNRYYAGKTTEEYFGSGAENLWSIHLDPAYEAGLVSQIEVYRKAGGTSVTVTITEDPWNSQTPDPYPSMVKWTQKSDGTFVFDYTDFDYFVTLNERCGVTGNIMAFSMADWANRVTYYSERQGKVVTESLTPGSERWTKIWTEFLTDFMAHTKEKGWFDRTYMAMDERPADVVEAVLDLVESVKDENGVSFKTALAVFTFDTEYLFDRVTNLSLAFAMTPARLDAITEHRSRLGLQTTLYTCGAQNSALSNPPIESVYTLWYIRQRGADGFLRWALDAFNADPLNSSDHRLFAAGDIYMIYPDDKGGSTTNAHTSVRFEKLAEGVRDISKYNWLLENYPAYEKSLTRVLENVGGNLSDTVTKAQSKINDVAREAAVSEWIQTAEASKFASDATLTAAVAAAKAVLAKASPTNGELTEAAYAIIATLDTLNKLDAAESPTDTEETTTPVEDPAEAPDTGTPTEAETDTPKNGCGSALGLGAAATAAMAAVSLKKKKED